MSVPRTAPRLLAVLTALFIATSTVLGTAPLVHAVGPDQPVLTGSFQDALGCAGDWQPDCTASQLSEDPESGMFTATVDIPPGDHTYNVAIGGDRDENYGAGGVPGGEEISFSHDGGPVTFWYDSATHVVQSSAEGPFVTLPGSFNAALGCSEDWMPSCMRTWMQDADGDGVYTFSTEELPRGSYEVKAAHGGSWDESYGVDGAPDGDNHTFSTQEGDLVSFRYDPATHELSIEASDPLTAGSGTQRAHFVDESTIAWPADLVGDGPQTRWELFTAPEGGIGVEAGEVTGGQSLCYLTLS